MDRSYKHFERLLGEHTWAKFLKNPTSEEKPRMTRVYYSTYASGREAQKDGEWRPKISSLRKCRTPCRLEENQRRGRLVQILVA